MKMSKEGRNFVIGLLIIGALVVFSDDVWHFVSIILNSLTNYPK